jgi:hypothetical protein
MSLRSLGRNVAIMSSLATSALFFATTKPFLAWISSDGEIERDDPSSMEWTIRRYQEVGVVMRGL